MAATFQQQQESIDRSAAERERGRRVTQLRAVARHYDSIIDHVKQLHTDGSLEAVLVVDDVIKHCRDMIEESGATIGKLIEMGAL